MIRSTKHYFTSYINTGKIKLVNDFLYEYRKAVQFYIDYLWNTDICFSNSTEIQFSIQKDLLFVPKYIPYDLYSTSILSARSLANAAKQALSIIKGRVAIRNKLKYIIKKRKEENLPTEKWEEKLTKGQAVLKKPNTKEDFSAELNINNFDFEYSKEKYFDLFIRIKYTGMPTIKIPIKYHSRDHKWMNKQGKLLNGILISGNNIQLRFEVPDPIKKSEGKIVGGDTGKKTILTLSDTAETPKQDNHNHSLDSILTKLERKQKGSKSFKKAVEHRKNFINWSINQLNLKDIKQINLEHIDNLFFHQKTSRLMSHFTNDQIENKIINLAEETGVLVILQSSIYRSQRCSGCGKVRKANRKSKIYNCDHCQITIDADLNSALNHEITIPDIPFELQKMKLNYGKGFFWKSDGFFYDHLCQERIVLDTEKKK